MTGLTDHAQGKARSAAAAGRTASCLRKLERMSKALRHEEPDRVPVGDFFWGSFVERWRRELGLPADADPARYYDLDWTVVTPNMDPWIRPFEVLMETPDEVVVKTGFGATMHKRFAFPMAEMRAWETDTFEKLERAEFDASRDRRRFFAAGDNHLAGVGDGYQRDTPAWSDTVDALRPDFPVYGAVIEPSECLTRLVGQANAMTWMGEEPERMGRVIDRIGAFYLDTAAAEIEASAGRLDGFVVWGDVAYRKSTFMSPRYWRTYFAPWLRRMTALAHARGLPVIYHSCGNIRAIFEDLIDMGIDALNPLEAKAGLDALELRRRYGHRFGVCGNSDIRVWELGDPAAIRREVLRKLNAAKGGGYIFQSDHSVTSGVAGPVYDGIVKLVREFGTYPLRLGEYDEAVDGPAAGK
ncbi:MAG TPA: uroporphyrinogen decarboxylase family protein [Burkholderiales bacterium]|nr:uroporphyrinogen decarboxylase family protein [Burkholderiales bacterium]